MPLQKSAAYLVETLTVLVSYASRFTVRDATSLHFSRLFDKGPFTCTDIENEGATAGVKVVNVTFEEVRRAIVLLRVFVTDVVTFVLEDFVFVLYK